MKNLLITSAFCLLAATACKKADTPQAVEGNEQQAPVAAQDGAAAQADGEAAADKPQAEARSEQAVEAGTALNAETPEEILSAVPGEGKLHAVFTTSMGEINCTLFEEQTPITVANFVGLANGSKAYQDPQTNEIKRANYYNGLIFHRVIPDFMIQGGCPLGRGMGGPGFQFQDEIVEGLGHSKAGILSMANAGPGTNGSQFFITDTATPFLDGRHTVFGECENLDVVKAIANVPRNRMDRPNEDVTILSLRIERR